MAQPDQRFGVQLARPLAAETQGRADLTEEEGSMAVQSIASYDDVVQTSWQALHQRLEGVLHRLGFPHRSRVRQR